MKTRVIIFALTLCCFFITSMNVVIAQYSETFLDPKDDVIKQEYSDIDVNITENVTNKQVSPTISPITLRLSPFVSS